MVTVLRQSLSVTLIVLYLWQLANEVNMIDIHAVKVVAPLKPTTLLDVQGYPTRTSSLAGGSKQPPIPHPRYDTLWIFSI